MTAFESGAFSFGIFRRNADRPRKGFAVAGRGGTSRATGLPRSVIVISCPLRTSSMRAERFCRASRMPASFMKKIVLHVALKNKHVSRVIGNFCRDLVLSTPDDV